MSLGLHDCVAHFHRYVMARRGRLAHAPADVVNVALERARVLFQLQNAGQQSQRLFVQRHLLFMQQHLRADAIVPERECGQNRH